jgi:hypothetical protein
MKIYIAGRMTGIPEHNYPAFAQAAAAWRNAGWEVMNPAEHFGGDTTRTYYEYIEADIVDLKICDAIAMLPGWNDAEARGSVWENLIAKHLLNIPVYDATQPFSPRFMTTWPMRLRLRGQHRGQR